MWIEKLFLVNFKNYEESSYTFSERVNCIIGENGSGKTNLLDAIYFLALTKSAFHNQDAFSIRHAENYFMLDGIFHELDRKVRITASLQRGLKKVILNDKKPYERLSEHIGRFPVVLIAPNDTDVIREGSEERRRFFDGIIAQLDQHYLKNLLEYNRILAQRNGLLKIFFERNYLDEDLLETYDVSLLALAQRIYEKRALFLDTFHVLFQKYYTYLSQGREAVQVAYESEVSRPDFSTLFRKHQHRDLMSHRTGKGVHKDEFVFELDGMSLKKFGSQGQQKSYVIALRLAQYEMIEIEIGKKPILLLDDIFDKLDEVRIGKLVKMMDDDAFGQVLITDARPERSRQILSVLQKGAHFIEITKPEQDTAGA